MSGSIGSVLHYKSLQHPAPGPRRHTYDQADDRDDDRTLRDYYQTHHRYYTPPPPLTRPQPPKPSAVLMIPRDTPADLLTFKSPLAQRYKHGTESMAFNFSDYKKFVTWRRLWLWLARAQKVFRDGEACDC
jgi:hypothetical protein